MICFFIGQGVSNVFDGERDLGGDLILRGVRQRPLVGFLSELEALRYVEVGSYYKQPQLPLWVVASQTHYSVLFALSARALEASATETITDDLLRAFSEYDQEGKRQRKTRSTFSAHPFPTCHTPFLPHATPPCFSRFFS